MQPRDYIQDNIKKKKKEKERKKNDSIPSPNNSFNYSAFFDALVLNFINANTKAYPLMAKMTLIPASLQP